jgi:glycosyltransferase involved in cell wall biosynthesis
VIAPRVSVLTTCHNDGAFLPDAIASLRAQTVAGWEHVVVLNGCTDDSDRVALAWQADAPAPVVVLWQAHVTPQPVALNLAARAARGDWLVWLNADDLLEPDALETIRAVADADAAVNCIFSPLQFFGASRDVYDVAPYDPATMVDRHQVPGVRAVRRDLWERTGGEDETIAVGADWDWGVRASRLGLVPVRVPRPLWRCRKFAPSVRRLSDQGDLAALKRHMRRHLAGAA